MNSSSRRNQAIAISIAIMLSTGILACSRPTAESPQQSVPPGPILTGQTPTSDGAYPPVYPTIPPTPEGYMPPQSATEPISSTMEVTATEITATETVTTSATITATEVVTP